MAMTASVMKEQLKQEISGIEAEVLALSHSIHAEPELGLVEYKTTAKLQQTLTEHGFAVEASVAELETSFVATIGSGDLVVGICAEMDALPQVGHACGHNIIASAGVTAALLLAPHVDELGITLKVFGTPAEEFGGGKILMLDAGCFDGVHAAMMIHPSTHEDADHYTRSIVDIEVEYIGKSAHAAMAPDEGINAGDAVTVAQVAIGLMRQHLASGDLVHGIVTGGGEAPNIVPGKAGMTYSIRANTIDDLNVLRERLHKCFEAGALATGCELTITEEWPPYSHFENDWPMVEAYRANAESLGRTFSDAPMSQRLRMAGSTDMSNISLQIPSIHPTIRIESHGFSNHHPGFTEAAGSPSGDRAVLDGGLAMAMTTVDLATDAEQRARLLAGERRIRLPKV